MVLQGLSDYDYLGTEKTPIPPDKRMDVQNVGGLSLGNQRDLLPTFLTVNSRTGAVLKVPMAYGDVESFPGSVVSSVSTARTGMLRFAIVDKSAPLTFIDKSSGVSIGQSGASDTTNSAPGDGLLSILYLASAGGGQVKIAYQGNTTYPVTNPNQAFQNLTGQVAGAAGLIALPKLPVTSGDTIQVNDAGGPGTIVRAVLSDS